MGAVNHYKIMNFPSTTILFSRNNKEKKITKSEVFPLMKKAKNVKETPLPSEGGASFIQKEQQKKP